jgi:hypothetical protein
MYPTTFAQERAARLKIEKNLPFKATHTYNPTGWDRGDPRGMPKGQKAITPGSSVQLMKEHTKGLHTGMPQQAKDMFNVVRDASGRVQHVSMASLSALNQEQMPGE